MEATNIDSYDDIYDEFEKWYNENIINCIYDMNDKQIAFAAWREGQQRMAENLKEWNDSNPVNPLKSVGKCKIKIINKRKLKHVGFQGEFEDE